MSIFFNDNLEIRAPKPIDTREQVGSEAELPTLNTFYNYLGMLVITLDTFDIYQLTSGNGSANNNWTKLEKKVQDDTSPVLGGNLDAAGFNITDAGIVQGHRGSELQAAGIVIDVTHKDKMERFALAADLIVTVDDSSNAALPVDAEVELVQQSGAFILSVAAGGIQTIISKDGNLVIDGIGSAVVLKKIAADTWLLIGALTA